MTDRPKPSDDGGGYKITKFDVITQRIEIIIVWLIGIGFTIAYILSW